MEPCAFIPRDAIERSSHRRRSGSAAPPSERELSRMARDGRRTSSGFPSRTRESTRRIDASIKALSYDSARK